MRIALAIGLAITAFVPSTARASGGPIFSLPQVGMKNKSGLIISFDGRGVEGNGYRPVQVEVTTWPPKPLTADRQIRVVLRPMSYNSMNAPEVSQVIDLPEGSTRVKATMSVPQTALWYSMSIETYEGGEKLEDLSQPYMGWANSNYWDWTEDRPTMLFIHPAVPLRPVRDSIVQAYRSTGADPKTELLPDVRTLTNLFPDPNRGMPTVATPSGLVISPKPTDVMLLSQVLDMGRVEMLPPAELPPKWLDLSQYDIITISLDDLKTLAKSQPKEFAALKDWLATGPLLNVYGVGGGFERLAELEQLLALPALTATSGPAEQRGWNAPDAKVKTSDLLSSWEENDYIVQSYPGGVAKRPRPRIKPKYDSSKSVDSSSDEGAATIPAASSAASKPPFLYRRAGLGCVVAIAADNPFPGKDADWIRLLNTVPDSHWKWFRRSGFSLHRNNDDYWTFLIPGVGEAPVVSFLLLVTLFAIVIGPVNYIFLGRSRRLYLLLLTVPAGAAVVTLCLFTYALTTDGLGVRMRARSFTALDQRTGQAAAWSRQSYYAAIAPSQGLIFPDDTTVFPIEHEPMQYANGPNMYRGKLIWDDGQHLRSGYLSSRTTTQFMLQRATKSEAKLVVQEGPSAGQPPQVENKLSANIRYLLLRDSRGDYFAGQSLADAAQARLTKIDPASSEKEFRKLAAAVEPDLPRNYDPNVHNNALSFLSPNYGYRGGVDGSAAQPLMAASLLERNITECTLPTKQPLENGTYTAVVDSSPAVPFGVPRVRQEASFHVIRGRY